METHELSFLDGMMEGMEEIEVGAELPPRPPVIWHSVQYKLFLSHFLSTWNSRSFEFAAPLFLAVYFPDTLLYLSIYAMVRSASAILFSSAIGRAIDRRSRIQVVTASIVIGRIAVILSALGFLFMYPHEARIPIFLGLLVMSCFEKLASIANLVSIERDWVVVIAGTNETGLNKLNARMRRIDLFCKLVGPLAIALITGVAPWVAILVTLSMNLLSLPIEWFAIYRVHKAVPKLHEPRSGNGVDDPQRNSSCHVPGMDQFFIALAEYFRHPAWMPSFALALLYLTVLSFGGQMITFLLASGFTFYQIAITRTLSTVVELSATWIAPRVMARITPTRGAMWFLSWQMAWLAITNIFFWYFIGAAYVSFDFLDEPPNRWSLYTAVGLATGTILSRVGLWGFDLCAQTIVQNEVREGDRGSFSSTETMFQNVFELLSYALTMAFARPEQFKWPVLVSSVATFSAGGLYAYFLRRRRGHLFHNRCIEAKPGEAERAVA